jgi:PAS domain S-box-containing protein
MNQILGFFNRSQWVGEDFKPYYEKENDFRRLAILHSIAAFVISPIFCYFVYNTAVSEVYFYVGLSYTVLFPLYMLICYLFKALNNKLIYFFIVHLFAITGIAFVDLVLHQFELFHFFSFFALYAVVLYVMQRLYPAILYNFYVLSMLIYGYQFVDNPEITEGASFGLFFVLALCSILVLWSRQRMINNVEDYSNYLKKIVNTPGAGYVLFRFVNNMPVVVDFNQEALRFLETDEQGLNKLLFEPVEDKDMDQVRRLKLGHDFNKVYSFHRNNDRLALDYSISVLSLKNGFYWLVRLNDFTRELKEKEIIEARELKYKNLYYRNQAGVFTTDLNSLLIDYNDTFRDMFEGDIKLGDKLFPGEQNNEWEVIKDLIQNNENLRNYQTHFKLKNGKTKWFIFNWYIDKSTHLIEGTIIDLTEVQKAAFALRQSEEKYRQIYEESNDVILLLQGDEVIDTNRKGIQLFGMSKQELVTKTLWDLSFERTEENKLNYGSNLQRLIYSKQTKFNWDFRSGKQRIEAEVAIVELILGEESYYQCVIHDLTELNETMRVLEKNRKSFKTILDNTPEGIIIVSNKDVLYSNPEAHRLLDSEFIEVDRIFKNDEQKRFDALYQLHDESKAIFQQQFLLKKAEDVDVPIDVTMVSTTFEELAATMIIFKDVSLQNQLSREMLRAEMAEESNKKLAKEIKDRIKAEKQLQEQFLRSNAIFDSSSNTLLLTLNTTLSISSFNTHCQVYFQRIIEEPIRINNDFKAFLGKMIPKRDLLSFIIELKKVLQGASHQLEVSFRPGNQTLWMEIFLNPIYDSEGNVCEISLVAHDITEKKYTEKEIVESLKEKEVLLKEIHHRVKNNLQVISSILNLQSSFVKDEKTLDILEESRNRIRSMAIIHESLYQTSNFSSINFSDYLLKLTTSLIASYRVNTGSVELKTQVDRVELVLDQAIPCGLLVNELITNALKYAFPGNRSGVIFMGLTEKEMCIELVISDDGVGMPEGFSILNSDTLGLQLVNTLVEQLDGEIRVENSGGIKYLITFDKAKI